MKPKNAKLVSRSSRRSVLKGTAIGVTGLAAMGGVVGAGVFMVQKGELGISHAATVGSLANVDPAQTILNVAITAEQLGVVFYTQAVAHANNLGLSGRALLDLEAALIEEQVHELFLAKQGAKALVKKFSFPFGRNTFNNFNLFIKVQQQLEALHVAAYLAAGREFAALGRPDLVLIAAQIGSVEAEHRVIGRAIGGLSPANNHGFSPVLVQKISDAVTVLKNDGYLTPKENNSFTFKPISVNSSSVIMSNPSSQSWS